MGTGALEARSKAVSERRTITSEPPGRDWKSIGFGLAAAFSVVALYGIGTWAVVSSFRRCSRERARAEPRAGTTARNSRGSVSVRTREKRDEAEAVLDAIALILHAIVVGTSPGPGRPMP